MFLLCFVLFCVAHITVYHVLLQAMFLPIAVASALALLGWSYRALIKPPLPKICGSQNGPPITSPRVKLGDGRHLAYREFGVPKQEAKHEIIVIHGLGSSKDQALPVPQVRNKLIRLR